MADDPQRSRAAQGGRTAQGRRAASLGASEGVGEAEPDLLRGRKPSFEAKLLFEELAAGTHAGQAA